MPTTIYDSSLITKRRKDRVEANSFINRIENRTNPTTGYAPLLGVFDQSIINTVRSGQMTYFRKSDGGCTAVSAGCPCPNPSVDPALLSVYQTALRDGTISRDNCCTF
jgi:hypothetical protein